MNIGLSAGIAFTAAISAAEPGESMTPSKQKDSGDVLRTAGPELDVRLANHVEQARMAEDDSADSPPGPLTCAGCSKAAKLATKARIIA